MRRDEGNEDERIGTEGEMAPAFAFPRPSPTLTALTTSALALPGIAGSARADAPIEQMSSTAAFSYYKEDDLPSRKFDPATGDRERYEVFTFQMRHDVPVSERVDVGIDFLFEHMSGASPWFVTEGDPGEQLQVMSGATIEDRRIDVAMDVDYFLDNGKDTFTAGVSTERDYLSGHFGLATERHFNDKNTTFNFSGAFSYDEIEPTDADVFQNRPDQENRWSIDLFAGLAQIISRASTAQLTVNYKHSDGYLGDPYKEVAFGRAVTNSNVSDERPSGKEQVSFLARYRHHFEDANGSLSADYRIYFDDWGMVSHTVDLGWYQTFWDWLTISPSARWYSQSKTNFYEPFLQVANAPRHRSSDYRLSPYGAISVRLKVEGEFLEVWDYSAPAPLEAIGITDGLALLLGISYERYWSDGDFGLQQLGEFEQAPALVNFHLAAVTISARF